MAMRCKSIIDLGTLPASLEILLNQQAHIAEKQAKQAEQHEAAQAGDNTTATPRKKMRNA